ncbi:MAG TPA: hypothetical protein VH350_18190 [Candidatus Sulfotelmatobacter sp.]|jgi:hypothetical protein|nr:hypothetical protein [Candidatus Sulfotelmatobacter sp.]
MKRTQFCIAMLFSFSLAVTAQTHSPQQGTIVRMRMAECPGLQHPRLSQMSGGGNQESGALCPEYVLVGEKVVYVITGKSAEPLIPLAEVTRFRLQKNEMLIRIDDASKESRFHIKAMVLRPEWDRNQMLEEAEASAMITHRIDPATFREQQ